MADLVSKEDVFFDNPSKTVDAVLEFLSDKAVELGVASDREAVLASFREREAPRAWSAGLPCLMPSLQPSSARASWS